MVCKVVGWRVHRIACFWCVVAECQWVQRRPLIYFQGGQGGGGIKTRTVPGGGCNRGLCRPPTQNTEAFGALIYLCMKNSSGRLWCVMAFFIY